LVAGLAPVAQFSGGLRQGERAGYFFTGLSQDDAGGLRYLLSSNNVALETLLPDVRGMGNHSHRYVNLALRPGIEKITFVRQTYDSRSGRAEPITAKYLDTYLTNGIVMHQRLERRITQPDFLFSAADTGEGRSWTPDTVRTGTSNWWNSASVSGSTNGGPGVIQPPVRITFNRRTPVVYTWEWQGNLQGGIYPAYWGSFDADLTNAPFIYLLSSHPGQMKVRFRLHSSTIDPFAMQSWDWIVPNCAQAAFQISTNLVDWTPYAVVTNQGAVVEWNHSGTSRAKEFFRVVPQ
jgi:hypothetical protein